VPRVPKVPKVSRDPFSVSFILPMLRPGTAS
jgi:hypothetical protein